MADNNGLLFYKKNYNPINGELRNSIQINTTIESCGISEIEIPKFSNSFNMETTYPGLLMGTGYTHHAKGDDVDNAYKIGFFFDHTSGMPIIPGSSLKGVLRSVFPQFKKEDIKKIEKGEHPGEENSVVKAKWIYAMVEELKKDNCDVNSFIKNYHQPNEEFSNFKLIHQLELELFDTAKNIFFDVIPVKINGNNIGNEAKLFANDSITPHVKDEMSYEQSQLKNPVPLLFLKVLPKVVYQFGLKLHNSKVEPQLTPEKIEFLFRKIILTLGLGAKTNVGYGQFIDAGKSKRNITNENLPDNIFPAKAIAYLKHNKEFDGVVIKLIGDYAIISFFVNNENCVFRKKQSEKLTLVLDQKVRVVCAKDYTVQNAYLSVKAI